MRICIIGKYGSHELPRESREANVIKAIEAARALIIKGHSPFCPHLSHWVHEGWGWEGSTPERWYKIDNDWLSCAEGIYALANWTDSLGATNEHKLAQSLGIPIYYHLEEVPNGV